MKMLWGSTGQKQGQPPQMCPSPTAELVVQDLTAQKKGVMLENPPVPHVLHRAAPASPQHGGDTPWVWSHGEV